MIRLLLLIVAPFALAALVLGLREWLARRTPDPRELFFRERGIECHPIEWAGVERVQRFSRRPRSSFERLATTSDDQDVRPVGGAGEAVHVRVVSEGNAPPRIRIAVGARTIDIARHARHDLADLLRRHDEVWTGDFTALAPVEPRGGE